MKTKAAAALCLLLAIGSYGRLGAQSARPVGPVFTTCWLLVGQPSGSQAVANGASPGLSRPAEVSSRVGDRRDAELIALSDRLKTSFRLASLDLAASMAVSLGLNEDAAASGADGFRLQVVPRAIAGTQATYRVRVSLQDRVILDKDMTVERGHRTIFARETGRGGETAFVVLAIPAPADTRAAAAAGALEPAAGGGSRQSAQTPARQRPEMPAFRSRVTLVPLDVRVIDAEGRPVTDLTEKDFTVLEDGAPQHIAHFLPHALAPEPVAAGTQPALRQEPADTLSPQRNRVFLIVFGRGRLQEPSKGFDGLVHFVRTRLLPQDQVALIAYNRATDFTTDHEAIARAIERYRNEHERIETMLTHRSTGLEGVFGRPGIPLSLQPRIDDLFNGPGMPRTRALPTTGGPSAEQIAGDLRRAALGQLSGDLRDNSLARDRLLDPVGALGEDLENLDDRAARANQTIQDLEKLLAGIEYMRYLAGEKHLVFVTEQSLSLRRVEDDKMIAAAANDARIAIDTIQTGGVHGGPPPTASRAAPPIPSVAFTSAMMFALQTLRIMSDLTGGVSSLNEYTQVAVDRLDRVTRFEYLLGYYPSNTTLDGRYRNVSVKVNRPGVTVLFRHGYYASDVLVPSDRRAFMSYRRVLAAGNYTGTLGDIPVTAKPAYSPLVPPRPASGGGKPVSGEVLVQGTIDLARVAFTMAGGRHVATLDLALFAADRRETLLGESWQTVELNLTEDSYRRSLKSGVPFTVRLPVTAAPQWVKVVVYDYGSDLLGSTTVRMK